MTKSTTLGRMMNKLFSEPVVMAPSALHIRKAQKEILKAIELKENAMDFRNDCYKKAAMKEIKKLEQAFKLLADAAL